jgi:hypothetical protein
MTDKTSKPRAIWLSVVELDDSIGPRRSPSLPNVIVRKTVIKPGPDLDNWVANQARATNALKVRYDLMPKDHQCGGLLKPFRHPRDKERANKATLALRERLNCEGYTVNGDRTLWALYVIELKDHHLANKEKGFRGYLYVGQTSIPVEERGRQHELGRQYPWKGRPKHSPTCHKYFKTLQLDLVPKKFRRPYFCTESALRAESAMRLHLEARGYRVEGGTERYPLA